MSAIRNYLVEIIVVAFAVNVAMVMAICIVHIKDKENNDGMMCIKDFMYMKIEGTVLAYPTAQDQMTCAVYEYMKENEK